MDDEEVLQLQGMMRNPTAAGNNEELTRKHLGLLWACWHWAELLRGFCVLLESALKV